jgi:F-type H+-transporting ATPase subunit delta
VSAQARPQDYAKAIYDLALEGWTRQLVDVQQALRADASLRAQVLDGSLPVADRLRLLDSATPGKIGAGVRRFLGTLIEAEQVSQLDAILVEFEHLVRRRPDRLIAHVTSAVALTDPEKQALTAQVRSKFGPDVELQFGLDSSLIGGVRLQVGDQVIDGSVAAKLAALRDRLAA